MTASLSLLTASIQSPTEPRLGHRIAAANQCRALGADGAGYEGYLPWRPGNRITHACKYLCPRNSWSRGVKRACNVFLHVRMHMH